MEEEEKIPEQTAKEDEVSENISPPETIEQNETQIATSLPALTADQGRRYHHIRN